MSTVTVTNVDELNAAILAADQATSDPQIIDIDGDIALGGTALQLINLHTGVTLTIQGQNNAVIDGGGTQRGFVVYSGVVTIQNLTIQNAVAKGGHGADGGGGGGAGLGGGLFVAGSGDPGQAVTPDVTLAGVSFINDSAVGGAGGVQEVNYTFGGGGGLVGDGTGRTGGSGLAGTGFGNGGTAEFAFNGINNGGFGGGGAATEVRESTGEAGFGGGGGGGPRQAHAGFGGGTGASIAVGFNSSHDPFADYASQVGGGGGGLGAGGDIFVQQGGRLTISGGTLGAGTVTGGAGGSSAGAGSAYGGGVFLQGDQTLTLAPGTAETLTIAGVIADMTGSHDPSGQGGAGSLLMSGSGTAVLAAANTFTGGTTIASGTLEIALGGSAGSGAISFAGPSATLRLDATPTGGTFADTLANIALGDAIDLAGLVYDPSAAAIFSSDRTTLMVAGAAGSESFALSGLATGIGFRARADATGGTLLEAVAIPVIGGVVATQTTTAETPINPFATVTISDPDAIGSETVTIQVAGAGNLADGAGFNGLTATGTPGLYRLAAASAAVISAEIDALVFTPVRGQSNSTTSTLTLSDLGSSATQAVAVSTQVINNQVIPVIQGVLASQATTSEAPMTPFATVVITDPAPDAVELVTIQVNGAGILSDGVGFNGLTATGTPGLYTLAPASPADITAEIDALVFTAAAAQPNTTITTITLSDLGPLAVQPVTASTQIIKTDVVPSIQGVVAGPATISEAPVIPFATVTISDGAPNAVETVEIQVSSGGMLADGVGFNGLTATGTPGLYRLATGRPADVTAEIDALVFTPAPGQPNTTQTYTLTLSVLGSGASQPITATTQGTNQDPAIAPIIQGGTATQSVTAAVSLTPFAGVTIIEPNADATETLTITLSGYGGTLVYGLNVTGITIPDGRFIVDGHLYNGLKSVTPGIYTLSGSAADITRELDALVFQPTIGSPNTSVTETFTLSDTSSAFTGPTVATISVSDFNPAVAPQIGGTVAGQTTSAEAPFSPFSRILIGDLNNGGLNVDTLTITLTGPGTLSGVGAAGADGTYTLTGTAAAIQGALRSAIFTPASGTPTTLATTAIALTLTDSVVGRTVSDALTTITDGAAPTITGTLAGQTTSGGASVTPFSGVTLNDLDPVATNTLSISFTAARGTLTGQGLSGSNGAYSLSGTAAAITGALHALVFTPAAGQPNTSATTTFTLRDTSNSPYGPTTYSTTPAKLVDFIDGLGPTVSANPVLGFADTAGNLFGTTQGSGSFAGPLVVADGGTVFEFVRSTGELKTLFSFHDPSGYGPTSLALDVSGNVTGVTQYYAIGPFYSGYGFQFSFNLADLDHTFTETPLTSLQRPYAGAPQDRSGNSFYFNLFPRYLLEHVASTDQTQLLFDFARSSLNNAALYCIVDADGNVFGTSPYNGPGTGAIWEYVQATGQMKTLVTFPSTDTTYGLGPSRGLVLDSAGNLFGATEYGGLNGGGLVYEIVKGSGQVTILAKLDGAVHGKGPATVTLDTAGNLFVATTQGAKYISGALVELPKTPTPTLDTVTTVLNVTPAVAPTITGTTAGQPAAAGATVTPFTGVTIGDANAGATDTLTITLTGGPGLLAEGPGFSGTPTLTSNGAGTYTLTGTAAAVTSELDALTFTPAIGASTATLSLSDVSSAFATPVVDSTTSVACYAAGTPIMTETGEMEIEGLRAGDRVTLADGSLATIRWIGERRIDCASRPDPAKVWPIRIAAHAFAKNTPHTDLLLSPEHAIFADGILIPAWSLVNSTTITQERVSEVHYLHLELERHAILLAAGLPAESWLDCGNRAMFANAPPSNVPGTAGPEPLASCAPRDCGGPIVEALRERLRLQAETLGYTYGFEADLQVLADGVAVPGDAGKHAFTLPAGTSEIRLQSRTGVPAEHNAASYDRRRLGLLLGGITLRSATARRQIALDDAALAGGFEAVEDHAGQTVRWTTGDALLRAPAWEGVEGPLQLELDVVRVHPSWTRYGQSHPEKATAPPR